MISLIYSADYDFQVLLVLPEVSRETAWQVANGSVDEFLNKGIEHYDVITFDDFAEMNTFIIESVGQGRKQLH